MLNCCFLLGLIGIVWCFAFMILASDSPETHKCITKTERDYIQKVLVDSYQPLSSPANSNGKAPWSLIFRSKACLAIFVRYAFINIVTNIKLENEEKYFSKHNVLLLTFTCLNYNLNPDLFLFYN